MPEIKDKVLAGRLAVEAYRTAHAHLYDKGWYKGISEDHTPLLEKLVADLEKIGITSTKPDFEPKKNEILRKLWDVSLELDVSEGIEEGKRWQ